MIRAFLLGFYEGAGDVGITFDDNPESPSSRAYDYGRNLRRMFWNE